MLCLIAMSLSCGKKEDTIAPAGAGVLTAQVDGQSFTAEKTGSTYDKASKDLTLTGFNSTHQVGFTLKNVSGPATISLTETIKNSSGSYTDVKANLTYAIKEGRTGTITVTKFDGSTIAGTFSMKTYNVQLKREVVVTNGVFNLPVTTI